MEMAKIDTAGATELEPKTGLARWRTPLMLIVPAILIAIGAWFWATSGRYVSTDNAYVQQDKVAVSGEVGGRIVEVNVRENQHVDKGDILYRVDPEPYRIALSQAEAAPTVRSALMPAAAMKRMESTECMLRSPQSCHDRCGAILVEKRARCALPFSRLRETNRRDCRFARRSRPKGERHGWRE